MRSVVRVIFRMAVLRALETSPERYRMVFGRRESWSKSYGFGKKWMRSKSMRTKKGQERKSVVRGKREVAVAKDIRSRAMSARSLA